MEELIELVLGNPLILLLLVGGLISLFRNKESANKNEAPGSNQQTGDQDQPKKPSLFGDFLERMEDSLTDGEEETQPEPKPKAKPSPSLRSQTREQTKSAHEKRMEQMQNISNQIESGSYQGASDVSRMEVTRVPSQANVDVSHHTHKLRKEMKSRLKKKNLIDSVIMAEVLGDPRSKKPYQGRNMSRQKLY